MTLNDLMVIQELWEMGSTTSLPSHWPGVIASDRALSMDQVEVGHLN